MGIGLFIMKKHPPKPIAHRCGIWEGDKYTIKNEWERKKGINKGRKE